MLAAAFIAACSAGCLSGCAGASKPDLQSVVVERVAPVMHEHDIPGLAVTVVHDGRVEVFTFGVASKAGGDPVTPRTIFEIGSVSKTFTGLLGAYASEQGHFQLDDVASKYWSDLKGSAFDRITMLQLATYSAGGLPLQFTEGVNDDADALAYFKQWQPDLFIGSVRQYSNPSIALFGRLAARSAGKDFATMMTTDILPALGLRDTYLQVPASEMSRYAWGYNSEGKPVRVNPGPFWLEAYGIKTTPSDIGVYLQAHMGTPADAALARAMATARTGRFSVAPMTQALGWELYPYPTPLDELISGNSSRVIFEANATDAPRVRSGPMLMNKTGSTAGFAAYVLCVPDRAIGIAVLANRNFPIADRVRIAHAILQDLEARRSDRSSSVTRADGAGST